MAKKEEKTNVMRLLEKEKVPYTPHSYDHSDGVIDGAGVARKLGQDPARVFKTLGDPHGERRICGFLPAGGAGARSQAGGKGGGGEVGRDDPRRGDQQDHRLYPGRMQPAGDEKAVPDGL